MGKLLDKQLANEAPRSNIVRAVAVGALLVLGYRGLGIFGSAREYRTPGTPSAAPVLDISSAQYGRFPEPNDPFQFIPCTSTSLPPALDDAEAARSWAKLFDPNPAHWSWGKTHSGQSQDLEDPYAGRGIFLCGYLDVPLDYTNESDPRIARLAVTKFQVSGLARLDLPATVRSEMPSAGKKSSRTIVIEPGGPGGSGTSYTWRAAEDITSRLSGGRFDVLGWDPRGVNTSLPAVSCFPYNADRDHWSMQKTLYREVSPSPMAQLQYADALSEATLRACWERQGDLPRFVGTAFVARDLEEIRKAIGEDELTGYLVSYGTGIGQTYANMFPNSVGRLILDGTEYVRDHRQVGGFGWTALDNGTDAWHDGFLGECINAGPDHCALARPRQGQSVTVRDLEVRIDTLLKSTIERPIPGYMDSVGPVLITYSKLVGALYTAMYNANSWPALAQMLYEFEAGNSTLATAFVNRWEYDPTLPCSSTARPSSDELGLMVICADSYDAPQPEGLEWWADLWTNMTTKSWIAGNSRFYSVFPCRHFSKYWPKPAEVFRGDLNSTLKHPVLLIAETYDPATPLRNGRRLLNEMGKNARLIAHHGYGHSSRDKSNCTDTIVRNFILDGTTPKERETACFADQKPYLYNVAERGALKSSMQNWDPIMEWRKHQAEVAPYR
ncbi:hypothetical protein BX600DRAFT_475607 [Xylariales sp. PMI_506]|nr:hypothetical protein BX600DRAFT_475607 [Xylariales sp. PMI_506]